MDNIVGFEDIICELDGGEITNMSAKQAQETIFLFLNSVKDKLPYGMIINKRVAKNLYDHSIDYGADALSAIYAIPQILSKGVLIQPFTKVNGETEKSGMMGGRIKIGGKEYLVVLVSKRNKGDFPYAIRIFSYERVKELLLAMRTSLHSPQTGASYQMHNQKQSTAKVLTNFILSKTPNDIIERMLIQYLIPQNVTIDANNDAVPSSQDNHGADYIPESKQSIKITESDLRNMIQESVRRILSEHKYMRIGDYEIINGSRWTGKLQDIPEKGWVDDIRLYSSTKKGGKTYALYQRCDNSKYFFVEVIDVPNDKKQSHARLISQRDVPSVIVRDALSLIQNGRI